jgi:transcriptional regulator with XRE-family HTH domain
MADTRAQQIAQIVRRARLAHDWTQDQLAHEVGVHKQTVYHIETAKHPPSQDLLERLEEVLDVDLGATSLAGQALIDVLVQELVTRMRGMSPNEGLLMASETLAFVSNWMPRHDGMNNSAGR